MVRPRTEHEEGPVFSHQVLALIARMEREDRELVGAFYGRARARHGDEKGAQAVRSMFASAKPGGGRAGHNMHLPGPLGRTRQTGPVKVPHFDMKPITRSFVPTSEAGKVHHRYARSSISAEEHFGYLVDGAEITFSDHLDYIQRSQAVENFGEVLAIDLADEPAIRAQLNAISIYSNIPGDRERQRSLFVAAERCEREPKQHHLTLSTANLDGIELIARFATTPDWVRSMRRKLREAKRKAEAVAARTGKPFKDVEVVVADLTSKEAHERLTWFDGHPCSPQPRWKQGRTGRNHYRFVGALPHGARPRERNLMLRGFVDMLARDGWMAVGVIHQPDPHADARNFHFHVDAYDRPAKWLEEHACWDFEYTVRRNGKRTFPLRQRKVNYRQEVGPEGKLEKVDMDLPRKSGEFP